MLFINHGCSIIIILLLLLLYCYPCITSVYSIMSFHFQLIPQDLDRAYKAGVPLLYQSSNHWQLWRLKAKHKSVVIIQVLSVHRVGVYLSTHALSRRPGAQAKRRQLATSTRLICLMHTVRSSCTQCQEHA